MSVVHIATQNLWGGAPFWRRRLAALARAWAGHADILLLQECREKERGKSQAHQLAGALGLGHVAYVEAGRVMGGREGVAVVSRYPLVEIAVHRLLQDRGDVLDRVAPRVLARVVVDTPLGLWDVYPLHLSLSAAARMRAVEALVAFMAAERARVATVGTVIGGDFNAGRRDRAVAALCALRGFSVVKSGATYPAPLAVKRLDYLLVSDSLKAGVGRRVASAGSDHLGLAVGIELAG